MKILYVTACMPYGPSETFIISEIAELRRRHQILIVPRSPGVLGQHAAWLAPFTARETLISWTVVRAALNQLFKKPRLAVKSFRMLFSSRSAKTFLGNVAVFPKGLWLARVAANWEADHIHCHWAGTTATMAMIASELSGIPWSLTAHRSDIVSNNLLSAKAESATTVRAIANEGRGMMLERGVDASDRLHVVPMGVPIPPSAAVRDDGERIVLCAADLLEVKGHTYLIRAWKLMRDRGTQAVLWLAGSGHLGAKLKDQVARLGLGDSVRFLGTIRHDDLLNFYKAGKIAATVLASIDLGRGCHEGIPVALVEAMSYGVPVIATSTGGIPELVQPGTGVLVPPKDPEALAEALGNVLHNQQFARAIGLSGRRWIEETRDIKFVAARLEGFFKPKADPGIPDSFDTDAGTASNLRFAPGTR